MGATGRAVGETEGFQLCGAVVFITVGFALGCKLVGIADGLPFAGERLGEEQYAGDVNVRV